MKTMKKKKVEERDWNALQSERGREDKIAGREGRGKWRSFAPLAPFYLADRQKDRQTDQSRGNVNVSMRATSGAKKEAFAAKKEHSGGHLKSHIISCSAKSFTRFQTAPLFLTLLGNFDRGQKQGGCETVSEGSANTRMREMQLTLERYMSLVTS